MVIRGTVSPDSTLSSTAGWKVVVYSHKEAPLEMPHLPPIGDEIAEVTCDEEGRYEFQLSISDLSSRGIAKVVVFAHPNPSGGPGWRILEVKAGSYTVDLLASSLPALPGTMETQTSASVTSDMGGIGAVSAPGFAVLLAGGLLGAVLALVLVLKVAPRGRVRPSHKSLELS